MELTLQKCAYDFRPVAQVFCERNISVWNVKILMPGKLPGTLIWPVYDAPTIEDAKALIEKFEKM